MLQYLKILFFSFTFLGTLSAQEKELKVYVFVAEECPISIYMAKPLREAVKQFGDKADFYAVFPSSNSTETTAEKFLADYELTDFTVRLDTKKEFGKETGATVTPEVVITNQAADILYRGRISNAYAAPGRMRHGKRINDLVNMLTRIARGETIARPWLPAVGCFITYTGS